ncbi:MAG: hypothetical protein ABIG84_06210 [archaeon]
MNKINKSLFESLKEISLKNILKAGLIIALIILLVLCYSSYLSEILKLKGYSSDVPSYHESILYGISILASIISILLIFEITRGTTKSEFRFREYLRFTLMFVLIYVILIPVVLLSYLIPAYYGIPADDRPTEVLDSIRFLDQNMSPIVMISVFMLLFLFYAPFIQYIESRGFRYSIEKSIRIFTKEPLAATSGIVISFLLFVVPAILSMFPFTKEMSDVIVILDYNLYLPLTLIPATFGMTIGIILMYSFIVKYYENRLVEIS